MKIFIITFQGKHKGAIGAFERFTETVTAINKEAAKLSLYDRYDHIHRPAILEIKPSRKDSHAIQ